MKKKIFILYTEYAQLTWKSYGDSIAGIKNLCTLLDVNEGKLFLQIKDAPNTHKFKMYNLCEYFEVSGNDTNVAKLWEGVYKKTNNIKFMTMVWVVSFHINFIYKLISNIQGIYGVELLGCAKKRKTMMAQRFWKKVLCIIVNSCKVLPK